MKTKTGNRSPRAWFKQLLSFREFMEMEDPFLNQEDNRIIDPFKTHAWVNIAITTLMRNIGRPVFRIIKNGEPVKHGAVFTLFRDVNPELNRFDLWKITSAWWFLEGEAFWFFGDEYTAGIPKEIYILNPRKMRAVILKGRILKWFYSTDAGEVPILPDELIHFKDWNPWNEHRGISPLIALSEEIAQDIHANRTTSKLMKNNAVPAGLLKTDQTLREEEADKLERRWENTYGRNRQARTIAVLGKGTSFEPISATPEALKFFELKRWNLYTILARYGIPPKVAHVQETNGSLAGKDTAEQHAAFWKYTILPTLRNFEQILETMFFARFNLTETGYFDVSEIPELQESAKERSKRDIEEIAAGIKTINDVLRERGEDEKPWGDTWYRSSKLVPVAESEQPADKSFDIPDSLKDEYFTYRNQIDSICSIYRDEEQIMQLESSNEFEKLKKVCFLAGLEKSYQIIEAGKKYRGIGRVWEGKEDLAQRYNNTNLKTISYKQFKTDITGWVTKIIDDGIAFGLKENGESECIRLLEKEGLWYWKIENLERRSLFASKTMLLKTGSSYLTFPTNRDLKRK
ncbi:MAG: phage portal protein [Spirochaetales bacterium]|uniref:Phage portal protein n=1 Tax=Candidatus Thalassospirochaeta sargassi TaxID=3119039 RepID=A0AAJ1IIG5_9SPIO|nr:phage portal protein [Spirochaetales bacterium]